MTTTYHTAIAMGAAANAATINAPLATLDAELTTQAAALTAEATVRAAADTVLRDTLIMGGSAVTLVDDADGVAAAQKVIDVDSTAQFVAGCYVEYMLVSGIIERNVVGTVTTGTRLTMVNNVGATGIANNTPIAVIPQGFYNAQMGTFNVRDYGATGNGSTPDHVAIQAAIDAAKNSTTGGGTVYFPSGTYAITTALSLDAARSVVLEGPCRPTGGSPEGATLLWTPATGTAVTAAVSYGCGLRQLDVYANHATYNGVLVDFKGDNGQLSIIDDCLLHVHPSSTARTLLRMDGCINARITGTIFFYADYAIEGAATGSFANRILIQDNLFELQDVSAIFNSGESWSVIGNTFEFLNDGSGGQGAAGAYKHTDNLCPGHNFVFIGNWCGDTGDNMGGAWINWYGNGLVVEGNTFGLTGGVDRQAKGILIDENACTGIHIAGNYFQRTGAGGTSPICIDFGVTTGHEAVFIGINSYPGALNPMAGTAPLGTLWLEGKNNKLHIGTFDNTMGLNAVYYATDTWAAITNLADGGTATKDITVAGAAVGNLVMVAHAGIAVAGWICTGQVTGTSTVTCTIVNHTGGQASLAQASVRAAVFAF